MSNRHAALLHRLGGSARVSSLLGLAQQTVRKWYQRGIPSRHWHRIVALSPDVTAELLDRTRPQAALMTRSPKRARRRRK